MAVDSEVLDLSAAGRYLAVLYSNKLVIYDQKLRECAVLEDVSSARRVLMRSDGRRCWREPTPPACICRKKRRRVRMIWLVW